MSLTVSSSPSPFVSGVEPITATDEELRAALEVAELPPLLPALAYLTGDLSLLREELRPDPMLLAMPQGGLTDEQQAEIRRARARRADRLPRRRLRAGGAAVGRRPPADPRAHDRRRRDGRVPAAARRGARVPRRGPPRARSGTRTRSRPGVDFSVVVIGAGMSGVLAGHRLQPGRRRPRRPREERRRRRHLARERLSGLPRRQPEPQLQLLVRAAPRLAVPLLDAGRAARLLPHVRRRSSACARTSASTARSSRRRGTRRRQRWTVTYRDGAGQAQTITANAVISAVGQLNRPSWPDISGIADFAGSVLPLRRVAPRRRPRRQAGGGHRHRLQRAAVHPRGRARSPVSVSVLQRTPAWIAPTPDYHEAVPEGLTWLFRHVPTYSEWNRFFIFWQMGDGALDAVRSIPSGRATAPSVSDDQRADASRRSSRYFDEQFGDRPDLLEQGGARTTRRAPSARIRDNGIWAATLKRTERRADHRRASRTSRRPASR